MTLRPFAALTAVTGLFALGCAGELETTPAADNTADEVALDSTKVHEKIVGGRVEAGYPAVGVLLTPDGGLCTATVIAPRWILSAGHCFEGGSSGYHFALGPNLDNPTNVVNVNAVRVHPQYDRYNIVNDIALARLASAPGVSPMPMVGSLAGRVGTTLTFVGFGITSGNADNAGTKRSVQMAISSMDATTFTYSQAGRNTCSGDSGGPAFLISGNTASVAGVTSYGDASCRQYGVDTRVDAYAAWIRTTTGLGADSTPAPAPATDAPAPATSAPAPADPCGGLSYLGECSGAVARWCENGQIRQNDCSRNGLTCGYVDAQIGYYCTAAAPAPAPEPEPVPEPAADPCGGLDYLGQCSGNVAQWCENGAIQERNCASYGQRCRYIDNQTGYYCR